MINVCEASEVHVSLALLFIKSTDRIVIDLLKVHLWSEQVADIVYPVLYHRRTAETERYILPLKYEQQKDFKSKSGLWRFSVRFFTVRATGPTR